MDNDKKKKKGLFSVIRESMTKTGGSCSPETAWYYRYPSPDY
jgi:hypothetical protein